MTTTPVEIADWEAKPKSLAVTICFPALPWVRATYYRRLDATHEDWGPAWYCNDTDGGLPTQSEGFADILNTLVLAHPVLSNLAKWWGIY